MLDATQCECLWSRCSSVLLEVVFGKGKSPLPDGQMEKKAIRGDKQSQSEV